MKTLRHSVAISIVVFIFVMMSGLSQASVHWNLSASWTQQNPTQFPASGATWAYTGHPVPRTSAKTNWDTYVWDEASAIGIMWRWNHASTTTNWERLTPGLATGVNYPTPREGACLVWSGVNSNDYGTDNPQLLLYGGKASSGLWTSEINEYDIVSNKWTMSAIISQGPSPRA